MAEPAPCGPVARLCANCEHAMVNDFDKHSEMDSETNRGVPRSGVPTEFFVTDHLPDLSQLRHSAENGCDFCGFLRSLILLDETRDRLHSEYKTDITSLGSSEVKIEVVYVWNWRDKYDYSVNNYLVVKVDFGHDILCECWNSLNAVEGYDEVARHLGLTKSLSQSYSDTGTVQWLKKCIANCEEHEHSAPKSDYLPDRLLDVADGKVRLVTRESLIAGISGQSPDYAALSYCWGTPEDAQAQLKTTHSSLAQRQAGIQTEDLLTVPALHDAIRMTRELEIPYLWIDSLCILQDDISDWERNSSSMDKVYGSAKVTLVAAASRSCREGFLRVKGQQLLLPLRPATHPTVTGLIQLQFKFVLTEIAESAFDSYVEFRNTPLSRRGWAVQERLLAARQIVFGPCNVQFTCPRWKQPRGALLQKNWGFAASDIDKQKISVLYDTWSKVVSEFTYITSESFTNPSDLLPSLSGLAHCFSRRLQDEYCAGHWKKKLLISLMWARRDSSTIGETTHIQSHRSPTPYILPSWSYLCKGFVSHRPGWLTHISDAPEVEYLDWERCLLRNDPMGALTSAKLRVRTRIMNLSATGALEVKRPRLQWPHPSEHLEEQEWRIIPEDDAGRGYSPLNIHLDYNSTEADVGSDALEWKWVLMGSCSMRMFDNNPRLRSLCQSYEECRYPYGLLVARVWEDKEEWCRVGIFIPSDYGDFTLDNFKEFSEVENITIV